MLAYAVQPGSAVEQFEAELRRSRTLAVTLDLVMPTTVTQDETIHIVGIVDSVARPRHREVEPLVRRVQCPDDRRVRRIVRDRVDHRSEDGFANGFIERR